MTSRRTSSRACAILFGVLLPWITPAFSESKVPRVGVLAQREGLELPLFQVFERVLAERGWVPGKNIVLEYAYPDVQTFRFDSGAQTLVSKGVDVIYAPSAPAMHAAYAATRSIPIVTMDYSTDPVSAGYVESYAKPGKNVTGVFLDAPQFASKWLEILKAINPRLKRVTVLWDPSPGKVHVDGLQAAAKLLGVRLDVHQVYTPAEIDRVFATLRRNTQAIIQLPSPMMYAQSARVGRLTRERRVLGISIWRRFSEGGGAVTYGPAFDESVVRSSAIVAKILSGTKASEIPIERPMRFEFLLNMKTIKALKLVVPNAYRVGAEEIGK